jgi:hypothetical protein
MTRKDAAAATTAATACVDTIAGAISLVELSGGSRVMKCPSSAQPVGAWEPRPKGV